MAAFPVMEHALDLARHHRACTSCSLQALCRPAELSPAGRRRLEDLARPHRVLGRGDRLFRSGEALDGLYVVREGALKTTTLSCDGEEQVLAFHLPGEIVGLDALAQGQHRSEATALGPSTLCELPFAGLQALAATQPALQQALWRALGQSAGRDQDHVEMLIRRQAGERIALFLQGLVERWGRAQEAAPQLVLPMSREDIGHFLGLALETVSRGFTRLQDDGVIAVTGRRVLLLQPQELRRQARQG